MGAALTIRDELMPEALRRRARHEPNRRAAPRLLAIADAPEGMSRAEAARLAGMERQARRDAVVRYDAEGLAGLHDRPEPGRPQRLGEAEQAALAGPLAGRVFTAPDPERDGAVAWTRADLGRRLEARFGKAFRPSSLSRVPKRLDLARQKARPVHPEADPKAQARLEKRGGATPRGRRPGRAPASGSRSGPWTVGRRGASDGSARKAGCAIAGGSGAGGRRGGATGGSSGPTSSPPSSPVPARAWPSSRRKRPPRP